MNSMVDRPKAAIAGGVVVVAVLFLLGVGFVAGRATSDDSTGTAGTSSGDGLSAGPTGMSQGLPVGFAHSEDGGLAAGLAWLPWLYSSPVDERPDGINEVLADGVQVPGDDNGEQLTSTRVQFTPIAVKVEMESEDRATVTLLGPLLYGNLGEELSGQYGALPSTLEWDAGADDWRVVSFADGPADDYQLDTPLSASDVAGYRAIRPVGAVEGSFIVEEVPGD